jgi:bacillaene synthase trans-acting acyltransferase
MSQRRTVFVFSGQGSQYYRMGLSLHEQDPLFREQLERLNALAASLGVPGVVDAVFAGQLSDSFDRTLLTHPAIFIFEYALALRLMAGGVKPDVVLGASMGTFAAATVAGCMDERTALRAVIAQAQALETHCAPGGMVAILDKPALQSSERFLDDRSELAAIHFDKHFVVAAQAADTAAIETELKQRGMTHQRLAVSYAFHSRWIDDARVPFLSAIADLSLQPARIPLACCMRADPAAGSLTREDLWYMARKPIRFFDTVARLDAQGPFRYIDVGPSGTMATFLKYALPGGSASIAQPILTPFGQDVRNLGAVLAAG